MLYEDNYLAHFGIFGQKWGIRRFQNKDGSLTEEGKRRYGVIDAGTGEKNRQNKIDKHDTKALAAAAVSLIGYLGAKKLDRIINPKSAEDRMFILTQRGEDHLSKVASAFGMIHLGSSLLAGYHGAASLYNTMKQRKESNAVNSDNVSEMIETYAKNAHKNGDISYKDGVLVPPSKEINKELEKIQNSMSKIIADDVNAAEARKKYEKAYTNPKAQDKEISRLYDDMNLKDKYAIYQYVMKKYPQNKASLILAWLYETDIL